MKTVLLSAVVLVAMGSVAMAGPTNASNAQITAPVQLTDEQLDKITAGLSGNETQSFNIDSNCSTGPCVVHSLSKDDVVVKMHFTPDPADIK